MLAASWQQQLLLDPVAAVAVFIGVIRMTPMNTATSDTISNDIDTSIEHEMV